MVGVYIKNTYAGSADRLPVTIFVTLHNEDRQDNLTFNASEVLNSPIIKELDMSKVANAKVTE